MTTEPLWIWGDITFSVGTIAPTETQQSDEWEWTEMDRIGDEGLRQFTGRATRSMSMSGVVFPAGPIAVGGGHLEAIKSQADRGTPQLLLDGAGRNLGRWVLLSCRETGSQWISGCSAPRRQAFELQFGYSVRRSVAAQPIGDPVSVGQRLRGEFSSPRLLGVQELYSLFR